MPARSIQTRLLSCGVNSILLALKHAYFLRHADLSLTLADRTETILNLPNKLSFFPTHPTPIHTVRAFLAKLHPVATGHQLIRLGPKGDGGYLLPDDLDGIAACFSPGVSDIAGFEMDCAKKGMDVFMADASVSAPPMFHPRFQFTQKYIGALTQDHFLSLNDWVAAEIGSSRKDLLLQMDIEGFEYETILSAPQSLLDRFRIMIVEFHDMERLFSEPIFPIYSRVFDKILRTHTCVHIHPNNFCPILVINGLPALQMAEFTFLRNDRVETRGWCSRFPHPLDEPNTSKPNQVLPESYYCAH